MRDSVVIVINDSISVNSFLSYEADSNVLTPADAFSCKISRIDPAIQTGQTFKLYVNGELELSGLIDRVENSYHKGEEELTIAGRDLMGLVVDTSVEEGDFKTLKELKLDELAKRLFKNSSLLSALSINYDEEAAAKNTDSGVSSNKTIKVIQCEPGMSVFTVLSDYAQRRGLLMWMDPDGTLVCGGIKGPADAHEHSFYTYKTGDNRKWNNILTARLSSDISKRYSKITMIAQVQGTDVYGVGGHSPSKSATDNGAPFDKLYKPLVMQSSCSSEDAMLKQVQLEVKKREVEGYRIELVVAGHSQDGVNYHANRVCFIKDEVLGLDGYYLILGRKFTLDRQSGPKTALTIGKLMEGYTTT